MSVCLSLCLSVFRFLGLNISLEICTRTYNTWRFGITQCWLKADYLCIVAVACAVGGVTVWC